MPDQNSGGALQAKKLEELGKLLVLFDQGCAELEEEPDMILKEVHHSLRFNRCALLPPCLPVRPMSVW